MERERHVLARGVTLGGEEFGEGTKTIRLCPDGEVRSKKGAFVMDAEAAREIIEAFAAHATDIVIDYEHAGLGGPYAAPDGKAPAAGWIKRLEFKPGVGLLAGVAWNEKAREAIWAGEYRYLSPVFLVRKSDRRAVELDSAAMTNRPAIPAMEPLAASTRGLVQVAHAEVPDDFVAALRSALGLEESADLAAILESVQALVRAGMEGEEDEEVASRVRAELGLPRGAGVALVASRLSTVAANERELMQLRDATAERAARDLVEVQIKANKICIDNKAAVADAIAFAARDPEGFTRMFAHVNPIAPPGRMTPVDGYWGGGAGPEGRSSIILKAAAEFRSDPSYAKCTSLEAVVNTALRDAGKPAATADELMVL
jgi:hypothetical protein